MKETLSDLDNKLQAGLSKKHSKRPDECFRRKTLGEKIELQFLSEFEKKSSDFQQKICRRVVKTEFYVSRENFW